MAVVKSIDELFSREVKHESDVRAITDDFSVVDIVNEYTSRKEKNKNGEDK